MTEGRYSQLLQKTNIAPILFSSLFEHLSCSWLKLQSVICQASQLYMECKILICFKFNELTNCG